MNEDNAISKNKFNASFKKRLIYILIMFAPLWLPIVTAYICILFSYLIGHQTKLFVLVVYASIMSSYISGIYATIKITKLKTISFLIYTPVTVIVLFFTGWGSLLIISQGH